MDSFQIVNLRMIPWGNAVLRPDKTFQCQHGPAECVLNTVEACVINIYPRVDMHFRFIYCVEYLALEGKQAEWASCFDRSQLGKVPIDCYTMDMETRLYFFATCLLQLELKYAEETALLNPPHTGVPWVVVNDQPLKEDYNNFVAYVCRAYRGVMCQRLAGHFSLTSIRLWRKIQSIHFAMLMRQKT
ncbi:Gamma-interferon-inducible lysosomal thiol reductase [Vitis vinifera]|uniref:Gamma-interferon-inducible lysosomal thiol reductase n=1 Tax=Vitis vinifera TaxID=29760 RepID=A0A438GWC2_VITVI|nr:Gamma-interferon-inducible lysosomal thiol reductase [Vitis vinifera]